MVDRVRVFLLIVGALVLPATALPATAQPYVHVGYETGSGHLRHGAVGAIHYAFQTEASPAHPFVRGSIRHGFPHTDEQVFLDASSESRTSMVGAAVNAGLVLELGVLGVLIAYGGGVERQRGWSCFTSGFTEVEFPASFCEAPASLDWASVMLNGVAGINVRLTGPFSAFAEFERTVYLADHVAAESVHRLRAGMSIRLR